MRIRNFIKIALWLGVTCLALMAVCDIAVRIGARGQVFDSLEQVPHNRVGLLLGTAPITPRNTRNYYYDYRIKAATELFNAGKIDTILVSGQRISDQYDETRWMRDSLIAHGVPGERIVLDPGGYRTYESVVRAKGVFNQTDLTIISQKFHNERAIILANHYGVGAVAYNADDTPEIWPWIKVQSRERLARVKLFIDLFFGKQSAPQPVTVAI